MKIESAWFSRRGSKQQNEDAALPPTNSHDSWWAAVADGMGGHPGGEVASRTAIDVVRSTIQAVPNVRVSEMFRSIQLELKDIASKRPEFSKMGTTLSVVGIRDQAGSVGHVGDSRVYHLRADGIIDRTVDQTEVQQLLERGVLSRAAARRYPRKNILLSVLSPGREYTLHESSFQITAGDRIIIVTDGVSSKVLRQEIRDLSLLHSKPNSFCDALRETIEQRHPNDDYSAICINCND